jgi:holo-[acyl-carrier protein] synthase
MPDTSRHIRDIIAVFLSKEPQEIDEKTSLKIPSVLKHRMYAALAENGFHVRDRHEVRNLGDLFRKLGTHQPTGTRPEGPARAEPPPPVAHACLSPEGGLQATPAGIDFQLGVDLEDVENLPEAADFRTDAFYTRTFSKREISYCLLQENPLQSFAGKFAAKEAIIKSDAAYAALSLSDIEILNDRNGKPYFENFRISISHTKHSAVAVAIRAGVLPVQTAVSSILPAVMNEQPPSNQ